VQPDNRQRRSVQEGLYPLRLYDAGRWHQVTDIDCFCRHWAVFSPGISMPGSSRPCNTKFISCRRRYSGVAGFYLTVTDSWHALGGVGSTLNADCTTASSAPDAAYSRSCRTSGLVVSTPNRQNVPSGCCERSSLGRRFRDGENGAPPVAVAVFVPPTPTATFCSLISHLCGTLPGQSPE